jgi:hypothetical protein
MRRVSLVALTLFAILALQACGGGSRSTNGGGGPFVANPLPPISYKQQIATLITGTFRATCDGVPHTIYAMENGEISAPGGTLSLDSANSAIAVSVIHTGQPRIRFGGADYDANLFIDMFFSYEGLFSSASGGEARTSIKRFTCDTLGIFEAMPATQINQLARGFLDEMSGSQKCFTAPGSSTSKVVHYSLAQDTLTIDNISLSLTQPREYEDLTGASALSVGPDSSKGFTYRAVFLSGDYLYVDFAPTLGFNNLVVSTQAGYFECSVNR